jgi:CRISP-associated protein Cas1
MNRDIVANGYLTQLGLFHKNIFNQFNLASDLMEPFRPIFDSMIYTMPKGEELEHEDKLYILNTLTKRVFINKAHHTVVNAVSIYVKSVLDALDNNDVSLIRFYNYEF